MAGVQAMETVTEPGAAVLSVVTKRIRAAKKKLTRIQELEALRASGKELTQEQLPTVNSKPVVLGVLDELAKVDEALKELLREELAGAYNKGLATGLAQGQADAREEAAAQLAETTAVHETQLAEVREEMRQQQEAALKQADEQWQGQLEEANNARLAAEAASQASEQALQMFKADVQAPLSGTHPLKDWLKEPIIRLLQLLYFSQMFDVHRNPWLAPIEARACLQYDAGCALAEGETRLTDKDLLHLAFFGRTLVDRMNNPVPHKQALEAAVNSALKYLTEPEAVAIHAPPAPATITMGELSGKLSRVLASEFSKVLPTDQPAAAAGVAQFPAPVAAPAKGVPASVSPPLHPGATASPGPMHTPPPMLVGAAGVDAAPPPAPAATAAKDIPAAAPPPFIPSKVLSARAREAAMAGSANSTGSAGSALPPAGMAASMMGRMLSGSTTKSSSPAPGGPPPPPPVGPKSTQLPVGMLDDGTNDVHQYQQQQQQAQPMAYPPIAPQTDHHAFGMRPPATAPAAHPLQHMLPHMAMGKFTLSDTGAPVPYEAVQAAAHNSHAYMAKPNI